MVPAVRCLIRFDLASFLPPITLESTVMLNLTPLSARQHATLPQAQPRPDAQPPVQFSGKITPEEAGHYNNLQNLDSLLTHTPPIMALRTFAPKTSSPEMMHALGQLAIQTLGTINAPVFPSTQATLLHSAITRGRVELVNALLSLGADPLVRDKAGKTSVDWLNEKFAPKVPKNRREQVAHQEQVDAIYKALMGPVLQAAQAAQSQPKPESSNSFWTTLFGMGGKSKEPAMPGSDRFAADAVKQFQAFKSRSVKKRDEAPVSPIAVESTQPDLKPGSGAVTPADPSLERVPLVDAQVAPAVLSEPSAASDLTREVKALQENAVTLNETLREAKRSLTEMQTRLAESADRNHELKAKLEQSEREKQQTQAQDRQALKAAIAAQRHAETQLAQVRKQLTTQQRTREESTAQLQAEAHRLKKSIEARETQIASQQVAMTMQHEAQNEAQEQASRTQARLEAELNQLRETTQHETQRLRSQLENQASQRKGQDRKIQQLSGQCQHLQKLLQQENARAKSAVNHPEALKLQAELQEKVTRLEAENQAFQQKVEALKTQYAASEAILKQKVAAMDKRNLSLQSVLTESAEKQASAASQQKSQLASLLHSNHQYMRQLSDVEDERDALKRQVETLREQQAVMRQTMDQIYQGSLAMGYHQQSQILQLHQEQVQRETGHQQRRHRARQVISDVMGHSSVRHLAQQEEIKLKSFAVAELHKAIMEASDLEEARQTVALLEKYMQKQHGKKLV